MKKAPKSKSFPEFFFSCNSQNSSNSYNDYIKCHYDAQLIHEKSYFKSDLKTELHSIQMIVFAVKDSNQNQCHIWNEQKTILMNAEKISFRFNHLIVLINLKRTASLNEDMFNFLVDNIYLCFFQLLQRLKKKGIFCIELNDILKNMLMQKKGLRYCEKLIQFIFFKSNQNQFIYLSAFTDNLIVYSHDLNVQIEIQLVLLDKTDYFDNFIHSKQKCFQLQFINLHEYTQYLEQKKQNENVLSVDHIRFLFMKELAGKIKSLNFQDSSEQESDQLLWFQLDSYSEQLLQVIAALNNASYSEKFLQKMTICININHKDIKNLFKYQNEHNKIQQISKDIYQLALEMICSSDS
ncbi:hypothetical protein ABPG72_021065 [Tetrahymena utriculariae]